MIQLILVAVFCFVAFSLYCVLGCMEKINPSKWTPPRQANFQWREKRYRDYRRPWDN